mmetsp:Transcript_47982/g.127217  ORF Transcript_47982/g.127217 Transcript_47982/m.127217 type:complete len:91 (+) Transcript_47982:66-338(+)|eukprot:CAMPEP_0113680646 /NCGR_PEP_ID=MMETSP0038_2-20120614/11461_1 /TAXON_ID=2898 /ORGANISM="Cryptomonas paramecium" /LENGTH=90 /DNA_ID=CAMNT_0000599103 /DNA_START=60 /DNA_END=332 /DNA_ORIENTATION=- /assembly_acc=CAM_ASM_000170
MWDDRHPFRTAEAFRTSTCTGEKLVSLSANPAATADWENDIEPPVSAGVIEKVLDASDPTYENELLWDDRHPFRTAKAFGATLMPRAPSA